MRSPGPARPSTPLTGAPILSPAACPTQLVPELRDALTAWIDAARGVATAIAGNVGPDEFNAAITKLNDSRSDRADSVRRLILTNLTARRQLTPRGVRR